MKILLVVIIGVLFVMCFNALHDYFLFEKFKVGYRIDLYKNENIALGTYKKINSYKILARKNENISVLASNDEIVDFDLYVLISSIDKIEIIDEKGCLSNVVYKIEPHAWF
jgi:hypothetical protein